MNAHSPMEVLDVEARRAGSWQERRAIAYPLLLLLAVLLVIPAGRPAATIHDSLAIYWVWADQFTAELGRGVIYPRWLPVSDGGLGSPVFYFYPPLAFYLSAIFGLLGASAYGSLIGAFSAAFAASGIGCWHWLKGRSNHPLLAAAFFVAAPYHVFNFAVRGALAESVAIALIPPLAIGLRRIAERRRGVVLTAAAYGAMICTHLPLALLVSVFLIAPYALLHREHLGKFAASAAIGILLAAIYLVPALAFRAYHDVEQLYRTENLTTGYWSVYQAHWRDPIYAAVFAIIIALASAAAVPAVRKDGWARYALVILVLVAGVVPFAWSLPLLRDVQFPYRALPIVEFALATALARLPRHGSGAALAVVPALLATFVVLPGFHLPGDDLRRLEALHPDVYEYLPKGVMKPGQTSARLADVIAARIPPPHVPGMIVEPRFYFPSWSCGSEEPRTQLLMHDASCAPRIVWTAAEKIGAAISAAAALILLALGVAGRNAPSRGPARLLRTSVSKAERAIGDGGGGGSPGTDER